LLVTPHTHKKKNLLKLYLLLNYNISDNHRVGQGKKFKKKKKKRKNTSVCWSLLQSKQICDLSSRLSKTSLC
jgi:CRISPR/Cas system-associated endoribonuclease Cas2